MVVRVCVLEPIVSVVCLQQKPAYKLYSVRSTHSQESAPSRNDHEREQAEEKLRGWQSKDQRLMGNIEAYI